MRIALLTIAMDPTSRSTNIARALSLTDAAASRQPPPGLIVVPAGCDRVQNDHHIFSRAMSEMYLASMSARAREWGVLLAFGQRRLTGDTPSDVAALLDADGDERLVMKAGETREAAAETVFGSMSICMRSAGLSSATSLDFHVGAQLTIVLAEPLNGNRANAMDREYCEQVAALTGSCVCLARAAVASGALDECACCSNETLLGAPLKLRAGHVVLAEVPMAADAKAS